MERKEYRLRNRITNPVFRYLIWMVFFLPLVANGENEVPTNKTQPKQSNGFIENKGQIIDQNNKTNPAVLFLLNTPGMNVQIRKGGFSYDIYQMDKKKSNPKMASGTQFQKFSSPHSLPISRYRFHRIDIDLVHSNPNPVIETFSPSSDYLNYYTTGTSSDGVTNVKSFGGVTYHDVYPGIDLQFISGDGGVFEYNFLIRPGGDIASIQLKVSGAEKVKKFRDGIRMNTSLGDVDETIPLSYYTSDNKQVPVKGRFKKIADDVFGFSVDQTIPVGASLLIDPVPARRWGTYYGGVADDFMWNNSLAVDSSGNVILGASTNSLTNIATSGAFQSTIGSPTDGFFVKFDGNGQRLWGTYYGGGGGDAVNGLSVDHSGNIIVAGLTSSSNNIASPGAFQTVLHGSMDGFVAKFNPAGIRLWGTYYGGNHIPPEIETIQACLTDSNENVYCFGETSAPDFISTPGSHQPNIGGNQDAFIVKFTPDGNRVWGTYYGGANAEQNPWGCINKDGLIFITGNTYSSENIATPGSFLSTIGNMPKGFLACFNYDGQRMWGTYFGGEADAVINGCMADTGSNVYFFGNTNSTSNIATPGTFQTTIKEADNPYIEKFSASGQRIWGTYFGATFAILQAGAVDDSGHVYVTGNVQFVDTCLYSANAYQTIVRGGMDAILAKFTGNGQRVWGTYYGGQAYDYGCATDASDHVYLACHSWSPNNTGNNNLCSRSNSFNLISTPGSHQRELGGGTDVFLVKFADCYFPDTARSMAGPLQLCQNSAGVGFSIPPITAATDYHWCVSGNLTLISGQGTTSITVDVGPALGSDTISVYGSNACDNGFPKIIVRQVLARPIPVITGPSISCTGPMDLYSTDPGKTNYQWSTSPGGAVISGGNTATATIQWSVGGLQHVYVSYAENGCESLTPSSFDVSVAAGLAVDVTIVASANNLCTGTPATFTATAVNGGTNPFYQWKVNGTNVGTNNPVFSYIPSNGDLVTCTLLSNAFCSSNNPATSNTVTMTVSQYLPVDVSIIPAAPAACAGSAISLTAVPVNGGSAPSFQWKVNGIPGGTNSPLFSYIPSNGDQVIVHCTSSIANCLTNNPATSTPVTVIVNPNLPVGVSIVASSNPFCQGSAITFTATPVNGGLIPAYQWKVNGINAGTNNPVFVYSPANNDIITCSLLSSEICTSGNPALSNPITMVVNANLPAGITIAASANPFCPGSAVNFTATPVNGGSNPSYQWKVNGLNAGTNSSNFSYVPANNDSVRCVINSNLSCVTGNPASSARIIMIGTLAPSVAFSACFDTVTNVNAKPFQLKGGLPLGGTYSGPGVNSSTGIFTPLVAGIGVKTINYSYINVHDCGASKSKSIVVQPYPSFTCGSNFVDTRDNKVYPTVQIGTQCWMSKNLDFGLAIATTIHQADNCIAEKYCYNGTVANCTQYGGLYQ